MDQVFEVRGGTDRALSTDASLHDPVLVDAGTMKVTSEECGIDHEPVTEFVDGIANYCIWQFKPTARGETRVVWALMPVDGGPAASEYAYEVIVSE